MPQAAQSVVNKYSRQETNRMKLALKKEINKGSKMYLYRTKNHSAARGYGDSSLSKGACCRATYVQFLGATGGRRELRSESCPQVSIHMP